jgi:hypothetical protein
VGLIIFTIIVVGFIAPYIKMSNAAMPRINSTVNYKCDSVVCFSPTFFGLECKGIEWWVVCIFGNGRS